MNGSTDNTASGPLEKAGRREVAFSLITVQRMLPLARKVVSDILQAQAQLRRLIPEQARLDRLRRTLAWPDRQRRYEMAEEIAFHEQNLQDAVAELEVLGVTLLDMESGRLGFPTVVNNRQAFFAWQPADEALSYWQFAGDSGLRPIPSSWLVDLEVGAGQGR